ncbi:hypothetical protein B0H10DRAFT_1943994 [Mycena sp. CBHHK59/15]|nr:hypothetical protein B0H10DRAFT_1943994 [Mycena sp. CBHHK59/15]
MLGLGPFITALEHAAVGINAHVVGKPVPAFFNVVIRDIDVFVCINSPRKWATPSGMHCYGACELGLWHVLVHTGKYGNGDESRTSMPPDKVVNSFAAFIGSFLVDMDTSESKAKVPIDMTCWLFANHMIKFHVWTTCMLGQVVPHSVQPHQPPSMGEVDNATSNKMLSLLRNYRVVQCCSDTPLHLFFFLF